MSVQPGIDILKRKAVKLTVRMALASRFQVNYECQLLDNCHSHVEINQLFTTLREHSNTSSYWFYFHMLHVLIKASMWDFEKINVTD
jgi:hypothetical protein